MKVFSDDGSLSVGSRRLSLVEAKPAMSLLGSNVPIPSYRHPLRPLLPFRHCLSHSGNLQPSPHSPGHFYFLIIRIVLPANNSCDTVGVGRLGSRGKLIG